MDIHELSNIIEANCRAVISILRLIEAACDGDSDQLSSEDIGNACEIAADFTEKIMHCSEDLYKQSMQSAKDARLVVGLSELKGFEAKEQPIPV